MLTSTTTFGQRSPPRSFAEIRHRNVSSICDRCTPQSPGISRYALGRRASLPYRIHIRLSLVLEASHHLPPEVDAQSRRVLHDLVSCARAFLLLLDQEGGLAIGLQMRLLAHCIQACFGCNVARNRRMSCDRLCDITGQIRMERWYICCISQ